MKVAPNYEIRPIEDEEAESPQIFAIAKRSSSKLEGRRHFLKDLAGAVGISAITGMLSGCDEGMEYDITASHDKCLCRVVCACDTEKDSNGLRETRQTISKFQDGETCTCDGVCSCEEVCTCDEVCSCDSQSSGSKDSKYSAQRESTYSGVICTCDTVCICNIVCTCDTICTCNTQGGGGGGGGYWVHYWYPN